LASFGQALEEVEAAFAKAGRRPVEVFGV